MRVSIRPLPTLLRAALLAVVATSGTARAGGSAGSDGASLHGAAPMTEQRAALEALLGPAPQRHRLRPPPGMDPVVWASFWPREGPPSPEWVALGEDLFFEPRLSADGTVACATCHDATRAFVDGRPVSEGIGDQLGRRNAPTAMNTGLFAPMFWDGRARDVEHQARMPIVNPIEMGQPDEEALLRSLRAIPGMEERFFALLGRPPRLDDVARAIGAFERTLVFLDSPYDRFLAGEEDALDEAERRGLLLFEGKGRCVTCHPLNRSRPLGSDLRFHNIGVSARHQDFEGLARRALQALERDDSESALDRLALETDLSELGRFLVTRRRADLGAFRTPQLRNVALTAPYMHDGSMRTLIDVVDHYNRGGEDNPFLDGAIEPLGLDETEVADLVSFLFALTDVRFAAENAREFERQRKLAAERRPFRDDERALRRRLPFWDRVFGEESR